MPVPNSGCHFRIGIFQSNTPLAESRAINLQFQGTFVVTPTTNASGIAHLGGSVSLRDTTRDDNISFFQRPEVGLADFQYVDTGRIIGADRVYRIGLEGAYIDGPYSVQGEFMNTWVERRADPSRPASQ